MIYMENKKQISMNMEKELLEKIENWRGNQRPIPNRTEAIHKLIRKGLEKSENGE